MEEVDKDRVSGQYRCDDNRDSGQKRERNDPGINKDPFVRFGLMSSFGDHDKSPFRRSVVCPGPQLRSGADAQY